MRILGCSYKLMDNQWMFFDLNKWNSHILHIQLYLNLHCDWSWKTWDQHESCCNSSCKFNGNFCCCKHCDMLHPMLEKDQSKLYSCTHFVHLLHIFKQIFTPDYFLLVFRYMIKRIELGVEESICCAVWIGANIPKLEMISTAPCPTLHPCTIHAWLQHLPHSSQQTIQF